MLALRFPKGPHGEPAANEKGGKGRLGGFSGDDIGFGTGRGPGASTQTAPEGHGAAHGGHGSGDSKIYGDRALDSLLGGSSGGASPTGGSGAGGGAIWLKASGEVVIKANVTISANGGNGEESGASGSGGAVRIESSRIFNHGRIEAKSGSGVKVSGNNQNRGSAGGRVAFISSGVVQAGEIDVGGEWLSNEGTVFISRNYLNSNIVVDSGTVTFDTTTGYFSVENGPHGEGVLSTHTYYAQTTPHGSMGFVRLPLVNCESRVPQRSC